MSGQSFWKLMSGICIFVFLIGWNLRGGCVSSSEAVKAMEDSGFTDVHVLARYDFLSDFNGCGSDDAAAFDVKAKRDGKVILAVVCSGYPFKGNTVRLR